jgi:hypothetical protein
LILKSRAISPLNIAEKNIALLRLTALWAFAESGLGGALHALQVPFTGLVVGGIAMIVITIIASISDNIIQDIFKAVIIVVVVKLTISPYTPITAYLAVFFQAIMGSFLFRFFKINYTIIFIFCTIAMLESALQKILLLYLFYGNNIIHATNIFINFILNQFSLKNINGSFWIVFIYFLIYFIGGVFISLLAYKIISTPIQQNHVQPFSQNEIVLKKKRNSKKAIIYLFITIVITLTIYFLNIHSTIFKLINSVVFSFLIISLWYFFLTPLVNKYLHQFLKKKEYKYEKDIQNILQFLPTIHFGLKIIWKQSKSHKGLKRINYFIMTLIHWVIFHKEKPII